MCIHFYMKNIAGNLGSGFVSARAFDLRDR